MIRHLVWLDDPQEPITDAHLAAAMADDEILSASLTRERGARPSFEVEMAHPGWAIFGPGQRRAAALVMSQDGTVATVTVRARGRLIDPTAVTGETLTLSFECFPEDWEDQREEAARAFVDAADAGIWAAIPEADRSFRGLVRDTLFGRGALLAEDLLQSCLRWWRHDPVSWAMTFEDDAAAVRTHNIGDGYDPATLQVDPGEGAVDQVTWTVHVTLAENVSGTCNLAPMVPRLTSLLGFQAGGGKDATQNIGWSLGTPEVETVPTRSLPQDTGRVWQVQYRRVFYVETLLDNGAKRVDTHYGPVSTYDHYQQQEREIQTTLIKNWPANYQYSQQRRENWVLTLDLPSQRRAGPTRVLDMGESTLGSLFQPFLEDEDAEVATEADAAQGFAEGVYLVYGSRYYRALRDTTDLPLTASVDRSLQVVVSQSEDWVEEPLQAPVPSLAAATFGDLVRGKAAMAHALRRMLVQGLDRCLWGVSLACQADDLPAGVELEDAVRFLLPARWDQPAKEATGRVRKVVETWSGDDGDTVALTLDVPLLDGSDDLARPAVLDSYGGAAYFGAGYVQQGTPYLSAGEDIEWTVEAGPLVRHVAGEMLGNPIYAVRDVTVRGSADEQQADFAAAAAAGLPPSESVTRPTQVDFKLIPLISERLMEREFNIAARATRGALGIDLGA